MNDAATDPYYPVHARSPADLDTQARNLTARIEALQAMADRHPEQKRTLDAQADELAGRLEEIRRRGPQAGPWRGGRAAR